MNKIIEITTPTCSVCKMIKPMLAKVMESYTNVEFNVYDHEDSAAQGLLAEYSIKSVPAFFFIKNDKVVDNHFGAITLPDFKKKVESLINGN